VATSSDPSFAATIGHHHGRHVFLDHVVRVAPSEADGPRFTIGDAVAAGAVVIPDPAFGDQGLLWNVSAIGAPTFWQTTLGDPAVRVGIADTGLDSTHAELAGQVASVIDFTTTENPVLCSTVKGLPTDDQLATAFGAPSRTIDFNGHGSSIGGVVAAALNGTGINGIAPGVGLVSLKIAQNCGLAYDSTILSAIVYAAANQIDVVDFSFSEYLDPADPGEKALYGRYVAAVKYALGQGTMVVAALGDDHARVGKGGKVVSHGILTEPPGGSDAFGKFEVPGGIPGVLAVAATANVVNAASPTCPADSLAAGTHQWCKPASDVHQPVGVGQPDQLAFYSNYGPRVNVAAPGGSDKFNLPKADRGGCEGWPWCGMTSVEGGTSVPDGFNAWNVFTDTSDFATAVPCFTFSSMAGFPNNQCYAVLDGTAVAAAHVSAALALLASRDPTVRHKAALAKQLKTRKAVNLTPAVSASDLSAGDSSGPTCDGGFCHLGGPPIKAKEAYGKGVVDLSLSQ